VGGKNIRFSITFLARRTKNMLNALAHRLGAPQTLAARISWSNQEKLRRELYKGRGRGLSREAINSDRGKLLHTLPQIRIEGRGCKHNTREAGTARCSKAGDNSNR
jgi:hypothetical protein